MAVIRYKNQSDYAFLIWIRQHPESFHWLDMKRFYAFVKSVARYRSKKWLVYSYFKNEILKHRPHFEIENIERFHDLMIKLVEFHKTYPIPTVGDDGEQRHGLFQRGVRNDKQYEVPISKDEYYGGGASKETMEKAEYF